MLSVSDRLVTGGLDVQKEMQAEVILCPNCDEDVPKTLYCLNCGYPLYKVDQEQVELEKSEVLEEAAERIELELTTEPDTEPDVYSIAEESAEAAFESVIDEGEDDEEELQIISVDEEERPAETDELVEAVTADDEIEAEAIEVQGPEIVEEDLSVSEVEVTVAEEEASESIEGVVVEMVEESEECEEVEVMEEFQEEPIIEETSEEVQETLAEFDPDPLVTAVMEHLAKNTSLKVRLVNLLIEEDVKEATFNRLFESYAAQGERWINRRNEMLERDRYDLESMEKENTEARMSLEELKIRKAIHDASEGEYEAKAPAYEWNIRFLDHGLQQIKGETAYLEDLTRVMSAEEIQELREMAENCYEALDSLVESGKVSSETAARIKATLEEALDCLKDSGCK